MDRPISTSLRIALCVSLLLGTFVEFTSKIDDGQILPSDGDDHVAMLELRKKAEDMLERDPIVFGATRLGQECAIRYYVPAIKAVRADHDVIGTVIYATDGPDGGLSAPARAAIYQQLEAVRAAGTSASVLPLSAAPPRRRPLLSWEDAVAAALHQPTAPITQTLLRKLFPDLGIRLEARRAGRGSSMRATLRGCVTGVVDAPTRARMTDLLPEIFTPGFELVGIEEVEALPRSISGVANGDYAELI
jgi:hypothetical protein